MERMKEKRKEGSTKGGKQRQGPSIQPRGLLQLPKQQECAHQHIYGGQIIQIEFEIMFIFLFYTFRFSTVSLCYLDNQKKVPKCYVYMKKEDRRREGRKERTKEEREGRKKRKRRREEQKREEKKQRKKEKQWEVSGLGRTHSPEIQPHPQIPY